MNFLTSEKRILIVEDEMPIADLLSYSLKREGYEVEVCGEGLKALEKLELFDPDMVLLDLMLPDISGFEVCKNITQRLTVPIIMITAKSDITDKILGLELGADDYIIKPFNIKEAIVRIKAIFRRIELTAEGEKNKNNSSIVIGKDIEIIKEQRRVIREDENIELTNKEYELLLFLSENKGRVFSRSELLDKVWGFEYIGDTRTVDIHVQRIRKKLDNAQGSSLIETVFGVGYKLIG